MLADDERLGGDFDAEVPAPEATDSPRRPAAGARSPSRSSTDLPKTLKSVISGPTRAAGADAPGGVFCFVFRVSYHLCWRPAPPPGRSRRWRCKCKRASCTESATIVSARMSTDCRPPRSDRSRPSRGPDRPEPSPSDAGLLESRRSGLPVGTAGTPGPAAAPPASTARVLVDKKKNASPFRFTPPSPARPAPAPRSAGRRWPPWPRT